MLHGEERGWHVGTENASGQSLYYFTLFLWLNAAMFKHLKLTMRWSLLSPHTVTIQGRVIKAIWTTAMTGPRTHRFAVSVLKLWSNCCWGRWKEREASTSGGKSLLPGTKRQEERKQSRGLKTRRTQHFNQTVINTSSLETQQAGRTHSPQSLFCLSIFLQQRGYIRISFKREVIRSACQCQQVSLSNCHLRAKKKNPAGCVLPQSYNPI